MVIQYPILNVSLSSVTYKHLEYIHIGDLWDYSSDSRIFNEYYLNQKFADQTGRVFKIIGKQEPSSFLNRVLHWGKEELVFEETGETIDFSRLKEFVINRYQSLDDDFARPILLGLVEKANNFEDLIG